MDTKKWSLVGFAAILLTLYNGAQPSLLEFRTTKAFFPGTHKYERYGPSMVWLDRLRNGHTDQHRVKLDFTILSSMMIAGLASGFKSQVANLLWMKSDEYWHQGLLTRQIPLMEAVVTLDPQFVDAWSTAGWHWAYNIYADLGTSPKYKNRPKLLEEKQDEAIDTGLDYLKRGSFENPDTYRLWFEWGWTRAEKKGLYNDETVRLFRVARSKGDARTVERDVNVKGKPIKEYTQGLDIIGRTIGHIFEKEPDFDRALNQYGIDLLKATPEKRYWLGKAGEFWHLYGSDYFVIGDVYSSGDATVKSQVKALVPDVEDLIKADKMRAHMASKPGCDQPTGAYITISARYIPSWNLEKQGRLEDAVNTMIGVMNCDTRYHLTKLPVLAKIMEIRGDNPGLVKGRLQQLKDMEIGSSQEIGLHYLATLYEAEARKATDPKQRMADFKLAYDTWYRARMRDSLDFYAQRQTLNYERGYNFTTPLDIVAQVKKARRQNSSVINAAPPPNVQQYQNNNVKPGQLGNIL